MAKVTTIEILFSCDGGECNEQFASTQVVTSIDILRYEQIAANELYARDWIHANGCHYCPACKKRIFG